MKSTLEIIQIIQRTYWWSKCTNKYNLWLKGVTFAKGMQSKSSYLENGEETRVNKDPGVQFHFIS